MITAVSLTLAFTLTILAQTAWATDLPAKGESQAGVESRFGAPVKQNKPVGDPPISSWEYDGFTVYFEKDRVVHTVAVKKD